MSYHFTIGYSGGIENLSKLLDFSSRIETVYTGGLKNKIAGGRPQYTETMSSIEEQVKYAKDRNIFFEIALNTPCGVEERTNKSWWKDVKDYLKDLEMCGVDGIVVSHPFLLEEVASYTKMKIIVSTICEITTVRSALYYEAMGAEVIIPSMNVNYNLDVLRDMKKNLKEASLRIMVNEHCLGDCPWRRFHHSHYAHSNSEVDYHLHCKKVFMKYPERMLTNNVIRPEDIHNYFDITDDFKIVGRMVEMDVLLKQIKAYEEQKYEDNYVDLCDASLAPKIYIQNSGLSDLFEHKNKCDKVCERCGYCKKLYDRYSK